MPERLSVPADSPLVRGRAVEHPRFLEVGQRLTPAGHVQVGLAELVEGPGLTAPVGQRPAERRGLLGQRDRRFTLPGLLPHCAERPGRPRDPGRVVDLPAGLQGQRVCGCRLLPVRAVLHEVSQQVDEVGALGLPFVAVGVARHLHDVAPLRLQPPGGILRRTRLGAARGKPGNGPGGPAPERAQYAVGLVGRVQVVVEQPAHGLPPLGGRVVPRGQRDRVAVDEVVEPERSAGGQGQQVMVEQGAERLLRLGVRAPAQGGHGGQAESSARADPQPPEQLLVVGLQRPVGEVEGGGHLGGGQARLTQSSPRQTDGLGPGGCGGQAGPPEPGRPRAGSPAAAAPSAGRPLRSGRHLRPRRPR